MARRPLPPQEPDKGNAAKPRKAVGCPMGAGECADWRLWTGRPQSRDMSARQRKRTQPSGHHTTATRARRMAAPMEWRQGGPRPPDEARIGTGIAEGAGVAVASGRARPAP